MSMEGILKGAGITAIGIGFAAILGTTIGFGVNGHWFVHCGSQYIMPAAIGIVGGIACIATMASGILKTKKAMKEYQSLKMALETYQIDCEESYDVHMPHLNDLRGPSSSLRFGGTNKTPRSVQIKK